MNCSDTYIHLVFIFHTSLPKTIEFPFLSPMTPISAFRILAASTSPFLTCFTQKPLCFRPSAASWSQLYEIENLRIGHMLAEAIYWRQMNKSRIGPPLNPTCSYFTIPKYEFAFSPFIFVQLSLSLPLSRNTKKEMERVVFLKSGRLK